MIHLRESIRKRTAPKDMIEEEFVSDLVSYCLQQLNACSAGTALYILNYLCPDDFDLVLDLIRLNLSFPHQHIKDIPRQSDSYEDLLNLLRARTSIIPVKAYPHFWLELTKSWLFTCPVDPEYYLVDEFGKEMFCQKLRAELLARILRID